MTAAPPTLTRDELIELAALDVYCLLDDYEAALFTRSFHHAPAHVQDEILALQARIASDTSILPEEEPDPELRQKVLDAVAAAIEYESEKLSPIASIGRTRQGSTEEQPPRRLLGGVIFWRAASFALAAMLVVITYIGAHVYLKTERMVELALQGVTTQQLDDLIGPSYREFVNNPNCIAVALNKGEQANQATGLLYYNIKTGDAFLLVLGIEQNDQPHDLIALFEDGTTMSLAQVTSNGTGSAVRLQGLSAQMLSSAEFQIVDQEGTVLLTSA